MDVQGIAIRKDAAEEGPRRSSTGPPTSHYFYLDVEDLSSILSVSPLSVFVEVHVLCVLMCLFVWHWNSYILISSCMLLCNHSLCLIIESI